MQYIVTVAHDEAEGVWYVESSEVPGLNAEAPTLDVLIEVIADVAPELIAANIASANVDAASTISVCVQHVVRAVRADAA
jgi:hypothetical protein